MGRPKKYRNATEREAAERRRKREWARRHRAALRGEPQAAAAAAVERQRAPSDPVPAFRWYA